MSVDRSLKLKGALVRHRNVLTRTERVERLKEEERWEEGDSVFGLAKVAHRKVSVGKKKAEAKAEGVLAGPEQAITAASPGAAGAPAPGKTAPAPAKAAAPAGKAATAPTKAAPAAKSTGQGKPGGGGGRR